MLITFRADASPHIGTGHVMRCLALAGGLRRRGARCVFISRRLPEALRQRVESEGHQVLGVPEPGQPEPAGDEPTRWRVDADHTRRALQGRLPDWLVVDHYGLDHRWQEALRPACAHLLVIDDLANRPHDCDVLLDPNLGRRAQDYQPWLPAHTRRLIGPAHALLRPEFGQHRAASLARRGAGPASHLLVAMGGTDPHNATGEVLGALQACTWPAGARITVVMGSGAPWLAQVREQASRMPCPTAVRVDETRMAALMSDCDLALGAAGGSAWERCCLGLPSLVLVIADNQRAGAAALARAGAARVVTHAHDIGPWVERLSACGGGPLLSQMSQAAAQVTDGSGIERVIEAMEAVHA